MEESVEGRFADEGKSFLKGFKIYSLRSYKPNSV